MRTNGLAFFLGLVLLGAPSARDARGGDLTAGGPAPALPEAEWIVPPEAATLEAHAGRVVLLAFWKDADAARASPWLDVWQETHWKKGLRVLLLARVDAEPLRTLVSQQAFAYPVASVASLGDYEAAAAAGATVLVGPDGAVAWQGPVEELDPALVTKLLRRVKLPTEAPTPEAVAAYGALAERSAEIGAPALAVDVYDLLQKACKQTPEAEAAAEAETLLKRDDRAKAALAASKAFFNLAAGWMRVGTSERRQKDLAKKIDRFLEKHGDTRSGAQARLLLASLRGDAAVAAMRKFITEQGVDTGGGSWRTALPKPPALAFTPGRQYFWLLETSEGPLRLRLMPDVAPMHVSSTIYLTELGYYDGLVFHRVIPGFMAQGGCPLGNGTGGPGYKFARGVRPLRPAQPARHAQHGQLRSRHRREPVLHPVQARTPPRRQAHRLRRAGRGPGHAEEDGGAGLPGRRHEEDDHDPEGHHRGRVARAIGVCLGTPPGFARLHARVLGTESYRGAGSTTSLVSGPRSTETPNGTHRPLDWPQRPCQRHESSYRPGGRPRMRHVPSGWTVAVARSPSSSARIQSQASMPSAGGPASSTRPPQRQPLDQSHAHVLEGRLDVLE